MNNVTKTAALIAATLLAAPMASAATLNLNSVTTGFHDNVDGDNVRFGSVGERSRVSWGLDPDGGDLSRADSSGYVMNTNVAPDQVMDSVTFELGRFTHNNNVIHGGLLSGVQLDVNMDLSVDVDDSGNFVDLGEQTFTFDIAHNETPNQPTSGLCEPDGSDLGVGVNASGCADVVNIMGSVAGTSTIINGFEFTLSILGFLDPDTDTFSSDFFSMELASNTRILIAEFTVARVNEVPVPAAGLLLLGGLAGMGALRRRRRT